MQHYELLFISPIQLNEKEQKEVWEKIVGLATSLGMKITESEEVGKKKLAYPIKKATHGYYFLAEFDAEQVQMKKFDRELRLMSDILRYLIVKGKIRTLEEVKRRKAIQDKIRKRKIQEEGVKVGVDQIKREGRKVEHKEKIKLEDLDKKLDEILKEDV